MKKLKPNQIQLIANCESSIPRLLEIAAKCQNENLFILMGELRHMSRQLKDAIDMQSRAFRDDALYEEHPLFPYGKV